MSNLIKLQALTIDHHKNGALPSKYTMLLSDGTKEELSGAFTDSPEQIAVQVANRLLELNQTVYWHPITSGHVKALVKFKRAFIEKNRGNTGPLIGVHTSEDMDGTDNELTKFEYGNFTMLRFHGLVAKDKRQGAGYWVLTRRGSQFLKGELAIPKRVQTRNNEVIGHDELIVNVIDVAGSLPVFTIKDELMIYREPRELVQAGLGI